jgi:hypothetical protein
VLGQAGDLPTIEPDRPDDGAISPEMRRKKVVLPAPFGPMIERSSPRSTSKFTWATAMRLPKLRVNRSVRTMGDAMVGGNRGVT